MGHDLSDWFGWGGTTGDSVVARGGQEGELEQEVRSQNKLKFSIKSML